MCEDLDGDRVCDGEERYTCGVSPYAWGKVCANPEQFIVRPADESQENDIFSLQDNCLGIPNPMVTVSLYSELISGKCKKNFTTWSGYCATDQSDPLSIKHGGARFRLDTHKSGKMSLSTNGWFSFPIYEWQPDHDLDGEGDACDSDFKSVQVFSSPSAKIFPGRMTDEGFIYGGITGGTINLDNKIIAKKSGVPFFPRSFIPSTIPISIQPPLVYDGTFIDNRYCWMKPGEEYELNWGTGGNCTDSSHDENDQNIGFGISYGYSHGSDPEPTREGGVVVWNSVESNQSLGLHGVKQWDWKAVLELDDTPYWETNVEPIIDGDSNGDSNTALMKYTVSSGYADRLTTYLIGDTQNPLYFKNDMIYARSYRETNDAKDIFFYSSERLLRFPDFRLPLDPDKYRMEKGSCPDCDPRFTPFINRIINIWDYNEFYGVVESNGRNLAAPQEDHRFFMNKNGLLTAGIVDANNQGVVRVMISYPESHDWQEVAQIDTTSLEGFDSVVDFNGLHFISNNTLYKTVAPQGSASELYTTEAVADIPAGIDNYYLKKIGEELYLFGDYNDDVDILFKAYKLVGMEYQQPNFEAVISTNYPLAQNYQNIKLFDGVLYLVGGGNRNEDSGEITASGTVWKFTPESGFEQIAEIPNPVDSLLAVAIFKQDNNLLIVPQIDIEDGIATKYTVDITTGVVSSGEIYIAGWSDPFGFIKGYCVYEDNNSIFPGSTNERGECVPVLDFNYDTTTYFDYKRTITGYKNNLYLGGLSGVRRVTIEEDGTLDNRELVLTGEIHNLALYNSTLYGANSGEIEVFSIALDGTLTEVGEFGADSCKNLRTAQGKLYTAEDEAVKVYTLVDPTNPALQAIIETDGKVIDLEVVDNKLYMYEETTSWFTTRGFTVIYDISDISSPIKLSTFEERCKDAEMQKTGETVYLGCKNGQHRVEETGLVTVSGEKNFVREGFVYDETLYQVFSGALHKSHTAHTLPSCGNEVVEFGETCDSNTVACSTLTGNYSGGNAPCNSTCSGYNESGCEDDDGW